MVWSSLKTRDDIVAWDTLAMRSGGKIDRENSRWSNYRGAEYTCLTRLNDETDITPQENTRFAALCDAGYAKRVSRTPVIRLLRTEKRPFALSFNF